MVEIARDPSWHHSTEGDACFTVQKHLLIGAYCRPVAEVISIESIRSNILYVVSQPGDILHGYSWGGGLTSDRPNPARTRNRMLPRSAMSQYATQKTTVDWARVSTASTTVFEMKYGTVPYLGVHRVVALGGVGRVAVVRSR